MRRSISLIASLGLMGVWLCLAVPIWAQEHVTIARLRPADVWLRNTSITVRVTAVDANASHLSERVRNLLTSAVLSNKSLRESQNADVIIKVAITKGPYCVENVEKWAVILKLATLQCKIEGNYQIFRRRDNYVYDSGAVEPSHGFTPRDQEARRPGAEVEEALIKQFVFLIARRVADVTETFRVRILRKDELKQCSRLAQGSQWLQFIDCLNALPEKPTDREFEGDRRYDIGLGYEALAYEHMWTDFGRAERYFELAERYFREAQDKDPREAEYVRALNRLREGKRQFEVVKARSRSHQKSSIAHESGQREITSPADETLTNEAIIQMVKAGLDEAAIIQAIQQAKRKRFDVTPQGLIRLKKEGVSNAIIRQIQRAAVQP